LDDSNSVSKLANKKLRPIGVPKLGLKLLPPDITKVPQTTTPRTFKPFKQHRKPSNKRNKSYAQRSMITWKETTLQSTVPINNSSFDSELDQIKDSINIPIIDPAKPFSAGNTQRPKWPLEEQQKGISFLDTISQP
jgi:hypothetical protein